MVSNSSTRGPSEVTRSGRVDVKKAGMGLTPWKGWKERWLVLRSRTLIAYKDASEVEISFHIPLDSLKRLEHQGHRCVLLVTRGSSQYYLSFDTNSQLVGWCCDIHDLSATNYPQDFFTESSGDSEENIVDQIIDEYASPISDCSLETAYPWCNPGTSVPNIPNARPPEEPELTTTEVKLRPEQRELVRKAISILCHSMEPRLLRISDPGGTKSFDLVELRLRTLLRLKRKWKKQTRADELDVEETRAFSEALADGYVLCQLFNTLYSNPIIRPDIRDTVNVTKFRSQCLDCGLPPKDLFLPGDIEEASATSLTRVAQTITTLVNVVADASSRTAVRNALVKYSYNDESSISPGSDVSIVEIWVDKFIATRLEKPSLQFDSEGEFAPSSGIHRLGLKGKTKGSGGMSEEGSRQSISIHGISRSHFKPRREPPVSPQVAAGDMISAELKLKPVDNRRLRYALKKDDEHIAEVLRIALESDGGREVILRLQGEDAQVCVDLIQDVLDKASASEHEHTDGSDGQDRSPNDFKHQAQRLLVKLSEAQDILPACLFIKGVRRHDSEAFYGGTFGDIYRATFRSEDVALKRIRVFQNTTDRHKIIRGLCREALLWRTLKHPYVLPFRGMDADSFPSLLCLVSPWLKNGTILKHSRENGYADIEKRLFEIAQGLAYLHSQHIIHGDLRGSNILVDDDWHARLADFGLAVFSDATVGTNSSHHAGSVRWMAPELHHPQSFGLKYFRRTFASDVYSFACVCVELYSGKPPFAEIPHDPAALLQVMAGARPGRPTCPVPMSGTSEHGPVMPDYLWELVQMCWSHNRAERPCMTKVVAMMQAGNAELIPVVPPPTEAFDVDVTLHGLALSGQSGLVRGRKGVRRTKGSRSI
ncbi:hypothetical protein V5O48_004688 [Marasmius crinis-equi]|uniref:Non-specific serine/threonine protein kinase n=1 Tax=Marasmius crinis-equi TaxID=585013 RepID=A0ABR3FPC4_9AGAR